MRKTFLPLALFVGLVASAQESSSSSSSAAADVAPSAAARDGGSVTVEKATKSKRKVKVEGNFKGKDPMIAPDGQSQIQPSDGSRSKSK